MALYLSPIGNDQVVGTDGNPLVGGYWQVYLAGTTTPVATYTSNTGGTAQPTDITLDSAGRPANPIWLTGGVPVKFRLYSAAAVLLLTIDNVSGVNDPAGITAQDQWILYGSAPTYISATSFSVTGDQTGTFHVGRRLKSTNSGGTIYSTITASAYASVTTVTVTNDSGALDAGMSAVSYGLLTATNLSVPTTIARSGANTDITSLASATTVTTQTAMDSSTKIASTAYADRVSAKIQPVSASVATNALTLTLNPTVLDFRSTTATSGTVTSRAVPAAISVVVPNTATLGMSDGVASRLALVAIDYLGAMELGVVNISQGFALNETALVSTTAMSVAADSPGVIYSTSARANVPMRVVGFVDIAEAAAGVWATAPTLIQGFGGMARMGSNVLYAQANATGTAVDFNNIPSWVNKITISFVNVSTNDASGAPVIQVGAGSLVTSGYPSSYSISSAQTNAVVSINTTTGFIVYTQSAADSLNAVMTLTRAAGNTWVSAHYGTASGYGLVGGGYYSLTGPLDRIRATVSGGFSYDSGTISIMME